MMATVLSPIAASTAPWSFNETFGNPATLGSNSPSQTALPDADIVASVRPWKPWTVVTISYAPPRCLAPHFRASLMAPSFASAPLLAKKTRSRPAAAVKASA